MLRPVVLAMLLGAASAALDAPVGKVVELLNDLKAKIESDGATEQKVYDKFACWCERTTASKAKAMTDAKQSIERLSEKVLGLKGKTANFAADIAQLNRDVASNQDSQQKATALRETENTEYNLARTNLEQTIGALEHAIKTLEGAGELVEKSSDLRKAELISTTASVSSALRQALKGGLGYADKRDEKTVEDFINNPTKYYPEGGAKRVSSLEVKGNFGDYAPGSGAIQGILKGMYDASTSDLESRDAEEATKQKNYEELIRVKTEQLGTLQSTLEAKSATLGEDTKDLADSTLERDETDKQLRADEAFFVNAKDNCKTKADEWAERNRLRTEEKSGIMKAIEILDSDEAKATFGSSMSLLLQKAEQLTDLTARQRDSAFKALATVARQHHSLRLASVAALVQTGTEEGFEKVMSAVDKMLAELRQEELDDITLRDYCQDEENKVETEIEDLDHDQDRLQGEIDRLEAEKKELQEDIKATEDDISNTQDAMAEGLSQRSEASEQFKAALKDDLDAVALLESAVAAMTDFYKSNKLPLDLLAKKAAMQQAKREPEYDDSGAPPDTFSEPYGGNKGGGIVSILGYLKEDVENEIIKAKAAESKEQKEFEEGRDAATKVLQSLQTKLATLEDQEASTSDKKAETGVQKEGKKAMQDSKKEYRETLKPKCDWMKEAFQTRREARQQEMTGLLEAKGSLAGSGQSLLQKGAFLRKHA